jgi:hypothetical protein
MPPPAWLAQATLADHAGRILVAYRLPLIKRGDFEAGLALLGTGLDTCGRTGWTICYPEFLSVVAEGLAGLGQLVEARATIFVTAYPDEARRARALKDGIVCHLLKPFDDNDLMDCVQKAVVGGKPPAENS